MNLKLQCFSSRRAAARDLAITLPDGLTRIYCRLTNRAEQQKTKPFLVQKQMSLEIEVEASLVQTHSIVNFLINQMP